MSITVTVVQNRKYCDDRGLTRHEVDECHCCDGTPTDPACEFCHGTGKIALSVYPFAMNLANENWAAIVRELNVVREEWEMIDGQCWGVKMLDALNRLDPARLVTEPSADDENFDPEFAHIYEGGRNKTQVKRYVDMLRIIAEAAIAREEMVIWY
jgi:hypothetical protein